ncbi:MAG TPA: hypothetical protein VGK41_06695, partial [Solirubrobacterales bacterium]
ILLLFRDYREKIVLKAIIGLAVAAALLAGCGGDDSSVSRQEYDQQLELICNKGLQEREEMLEDLGQKLQETNQQSNVEAQKETILELIGAYQGTTEEIDDIGLPEQGEKKAEELVAAREDAAAKVEADPIGSLGVTNTTFEKANKVAEDLEAKSCAT